MFTDKELEDLERKSAKALFDWKDAEAETTNYLRNRIKTLESSIEESIAILRNDLFKNRVKNALNVLESIDD